MGKHIEINDSDLNEGHTLCDSVHEFVGFQESYVVWVSCNYSKNWIAMVSYFSLHSF